MAYLDQQHSGREGQAIAVVEDLPISDLDDSTNLDCILSQHALLRVSEARLTGALSKGGKMHGVATNIYLWKTSEKPKETGHKECSKFGSCTYV